MLFGARLAQEIHQPWKQYYVDYSKLKKLLKEEVFVNDKAQPWTDDDETKFVEALDHEIERVHSFESKTYQELTKRVDTLEGSLDATKEAGPVESAVDQILEDVRALEHFSRINYTAFIKIVKKHDRIHPAYQVKPLLTVRLKALPFHSEDYSPLLYRLSGVYLFLRQNFGSVAESQSKLSSFTNSDSSDYASFKYWVHPDNVMEVKTLILRHLPILVYENEDKDSEVSGQQDPTITSLYFDNSEFELYKAKLLKNEISPSVRLHWTGRLADKPDIVLEKKVIDRSSAENDDSFKLHIKQKNIQGFLNGTYHMDKEVKKMEERHTPSSQIENYKTHAKDLYNYIQEHELKPLLRTTVKRSAFEIPGEGGRVRVNLDSDIMFIREDSLDAERPIRDPESWHRKDLDNAVNIQSALRKGEWAKFPYSVLEIRIKVRDHAILNADGTPSKSLPSAVSRHSQWINELTSSHLVKDVPQFSKFIQGVASLYTEDERVDSLPFWLNEVDQPDDVRGDPKAIAKRRAESTYARRTSVLKLRDSPKLGGQSPSTSAIDAPSTSSLPENSTAIEEDDDEEEEEGSGLSDTEVSSRDQPRLGFPTWKKKGASKLDFDSEDEEVVLPPGVTKPTQLIRQSGSVKVEVKVWLANERTFNKWLHVTTLLSALTFTMYSSVHRTISEQVAVYVAYTLFGLTLFTGIWGYYTYMKRLHYIKMRSEKHLDASFGPVVVALTLVCCLCFNFWANYQRRVHVPEGAFHY